VAAMTPEFLELDEVLALHARQLERHGGAAEVRAEGSLSSAVAMPTQTFAGEFLHADLFEMAAAYAFHIAQNQPFVDGNKRTGLCAALVFLALNGRMLKDPADRLGDAMIAVAERRLDKRGLALELGQLAAPSTDYLACAGTFIAYFERVAEEWCQAGDPADCWEGRARVAQEWRRLIAAASPPAVEVAAFLERLGDSNNESSGFISMRNWAKLWARGLDPRRYLEDFLEEILQVHDRTFARLAL
jgi:death-on-curing protein